MMMQKLGYYLFRGLICFFKIIPFKLVYLLSDATYILLYKILGYRKSVVRTNINYAFPDKSKEEKLSIEQKFFKNLSDLILESFKGYTISEKLALSKFSFTNPDLLDQFYEKNKSVIMAVGHMGNWELGNASVKKQFKHLPFILYKPLSNKLIDQFIDKKRARFGANMYSIYKTRFLFSEIKHEPIAVYMVADQYSPGAKRRKAIFFGKESVFLHGPETYAKKYNLPIIYIEVQKIKRGYYQAELSVLEENPQQLKEGELTQKYALRLEESIKKYPDAWMWSHKRWKDKKIYNS